MRALRAWVAARSGRERGLLAAALALTLGWLALTQGVRPVLALRDQAQARIARLDAVMAQLAAAPPQAAATAPRATPAAQAVTDSATAHGLTIRRLEPDGARLRVTLDDAPFAALIPWLAALEAEHALIVSEAELDRRPAPGLVAARLTLGD